MTDNQTLISRLEIVPIRQAFKHEDFDFTRWLEEHIDTLGERLGVTLSVVQREKRVGDFIVDLQCENIDGKQVIIENQLERSDHDHLGKLLTYLVNLEASTAIWVTPDPRAEHEKVVEWLNEATPADISFYLVKVEAVRIAGSPYAPLFSIIAGPDRQVKEIGLDKKEWADRHVKRNEFWKSLLDRSKDRTKLFANITPGKNHWISTGTGISGISIGYLIHMNDGGIELYIDFGPESAKKNKTFFDALYAQKDSIEHDFGDKLEWRRLDDKRASRINFYYKAGGLIHPDTWDSLQPKMIEGMIKFDKAIRPRLSKITVR